MHLLVALEYRFDRTPDGAVWTQTAFGHGFWTRYLDVFDAVRVVARVRDVPVSLPDSQRTDGDRVAFAAVPYYLGPWQYLARYWQVTRAARSAVGRTEAIILRVGSQIGACIIPLLRRSGRPYGLEVVGDPYDVFAPGAVQHPIRPFFRWLFSRRLRRHCAGACAVAYVTERALQRRYPAAPGAFTTHVSSVELPTEALVAVPRPPRQAGHTFTLVSVGTLAQLYKAPDILIDAVAVCVQNGDDLRLVLVGDGKYRAALETRALRQGLGGRVCFLGQLPAGEAVRAQLDRADLFVLPSHTEGLPRAMIEAMARGLPCLGSAVGGIPELLPPEDLVPPGNTVALAARIQEVVADAERLARMSARNLAKAREYREEVLRERRMAFYQHVREQTEAWLKAQR